MSRFASARVARLATVDAGGGPHVVPITFAVDGDVIWSAVDDKPKRSRELKRLANIRSNPAVSVLADHYDDDWTRLWWVRADGTAESATITFRQSNGTNETLRNQRLPWTSDGAAGSPECFDPLDPAELTVENEGSSGSVSCRIERAEELIATDSRQPPDDTATCLD